MTIQIRAGHMNPFSQMNSKVTSSFAADNRTAAKKDTKEDLQIKRQALQNQLLLLKAGGTDSAGAATENEKAIEAQLKEVANAIRSAKSSFPQPVDISDEKPSLHDTFKLQPEKTLSSGIYRVNKDKNGYQIFFSPYSDT